MKTLFRKTAIVSAFFLVFFIAPILAQTASLTNDDIIDRRVEKAPISVPPPSSPQPEKLATGKPNTNNSLPFKSATVEALKSAGGSGREIFTNTFAAFGKINSFRAAVQMTGMPQDNRNYTMEIEFAKPDRVHIKMDEMEAITIGNISYMKMRGQAWKTTERPNVAGTDMNMNPADMQKLFELIFSQIKIDARLVQEEVIDGAATNLYEFNIDAAGNKLAGAKGAEKIGFRAWIGSQDNLLRKLTFSSPDNKFQLSARLYDFNESIHITSPIN
jgi:hypothetical protein